MKKKFTSIGIAIGCMLGAAIIAYAVSALFFTKSETSNLTPKTIFQFDLSTGMEATEVGPGDSFTVSPVVYNDATENMYVFIVIDQPTCNDESLYTYVVADGWKLIGSTAARQIYAYAAEEMTLLMPGETTEPLTSQMTMRDITNADYANLSDLNVTITGYAIGTDDVSANPEEAWTICKNLGHIE